MRRMPRCQPSVRARCSASDDGAKVRRRESMAFWSATGPRFCDVQCRRPIEKSQFLPDDMNVCRFGPSGRRCAGARSSAIAPRGSLPVWIRRLLSVEAEEAVATSLRRIWLNRYGGQRHVDGGKRATIVPTSSDSPGVAGAIVQPLGPAQSKGKKRSVR